MNKKKTIKELTEIIEEYLEPLQYHLKCKSCIANLATIIYEIFEKKENKK